MPRTISFALVGAINLAAALNAHANWQYTRWGMTPEQVMAASTGQLKACYDACKGQDTNIQIARFLGPYQSGPFNFTAYMLFDRRSDTLAQVTLDLSQPSAASALIGALGRQYGEPAVTDYSKSMEVIMWRNSTDDINVVVIGDPSHVVDASLSYEPRQNSPTEAFEALPPSSRRAALPESILTMGCALPSAWRE